MMMTITQRGVASVAARNNQNSEKKKKKMAWRESNGVTASAYRADNRKAKASAARWLFW